MEKLAQQNITNLKRTVAEVCMQNGVARLSVFGSFARGDQTDKSDIDLLVKFSEPKSLFDLLHLEDKLSELLGRKVELVTENGVSRHIKPFIEKDRRLIYEKSQ